MKRRVEEKSSKRIIEIKSTRWKREMKAAQGSVLAIFFRSESQFLLHVRLFNSLHRRDPDGRRADDAFARTKMLAEDLAEIRTDAVVGFRK